METELGMRNAIKEAHPGGGHDGKEHKTWNNERNSYPDAGWGPGQLLDYVFFRSNVAEGGGVEVSAAAYSSPDIRNEFHKDRCNNYNVVKFLYPIFKKITTL